ncbi:extracellular nuclease [Salinisphaera sp. T5B8]
MHVALVGTSLAAVVPGAMAATITVDSAADMSGAGQCTLRDAIAAANQNEMVGTCAAGDDANDTIVFASSVSGSTITLGGSALPTIAAGSTLTIGMSSGDDADSANNSMAMTIDANNQSRIFTNQGNLTLNGLTLVNGVATISGGDADARSGGAILNDDGGVLTVNGGAMNNNTADRAGGAIEEASGATAANLDDDTANDNVRVTLNDVNFSGNNAGMNPGNGGALHVTGSGDIVVNGGTFNANIAEEGGALWNNGGTLTVSGASFTQNRASGTEADMGGGAIFGQVGGANGTVVVSDATFVSNMAGNSDDNESSASGGAILAGDGTTLTISDSVFRMNTARRAGGAIEVLAGSTTTLDNVTATGNDAGASPGNGGFLHVTGDGDVDVTGGLFARNTAVEGGAFWNNQGTMTLDGVSIVNNEATGADATQGGGGIYAEGNDMGDSGTLTITASRIAMNRASGTSGSGGGILVSPNATANITDTRIAGNTSQRAGGGIENAGGSVTLTEVTLGGTASADGNDAGANPGNGGGLHIGGSGTTTIVDSSVGNNKAVEGGGLWNSGGGTLDVDNSTVAQNSATRGAGVYLDGAGGTITLDYVSVTNNQGSGVFAVDGAGGSITVNNSLVSGNSPDLGSGVTADGANGNVTGEVAFNGAYRLYGGPTATQPLATDSAALDTNADCAATDTDQRGAERGFDAVGPNNGDGDCDSGAFELTDDPVVQATRLNLGSAVIGNDDADAVVLGVRLANNSDTAVTIGGFSGYVNRDDRLPAGIDPSDIRLTVYADSNDNGRYDMGSDMSVGSATLDEGYDFTVTFNGGGQSVSANDSVSYFVVADRVEQVDLVGGVATVQLPTSLYAGGGLLALLGLVSVGGVRRRTQYLLIAGALVMMLTACSDSDGDRGVTINQPGNDRMGEGEVTFVLRQIEGTGTDLLIGDGLPITGPTVSFQAQATANDSN